MNKQHETVRKILDAATASGRLEDAVAVLEEYVKSQPAPKFSISYDNGAGNLVAALGITKERADDLFFKLEVITHDVLRPTKEPETIDSDNFFKLFLTHAETAQEGVLLAYLAGRQTSSLIDEGTFFEEEEDG